MPVTSIRLTLFPVLLLLQLTLSPLAVLAEPLGSISAGLGGGMGDNDVGPFAVSFKFWSRSYEVGGEVFYDGDRDDDIDQLGFVWAFYRFELHPEERNRLYLGVGGGTLFEANYFKDSLGFMSALGWDGKEYGMEFKYGYFAPSIYSFVVYYHF